MKVFKDRDFNEEIKSERYNIYLAGKKLIILEIRDNNLVFALNFINPIKYRIKIKKNNYSLNIK